MYKKDLASPYYQYYIKEISTASIGPQADGTYVKNPMACESGFTLNYYPDKQIEAKENDKSTQYSRCVMDNNAVNINHIKIKLDMFKEFKDKMDKCQSEKYKDVYIQEYLYFYYNPEHYILYKDEEQVMDYLLNGQYNSFSFIILLFFLFLI